MDLEVYLKELNIDSGIIQKMQEEKVDVNVIFKMTDEQLGWFIPNVGDRILIKDFAKKVAEGKGRKHQLLESIKLRLAEIKTKRLGKRKLPVKENPKPKKAARPRNATKSSIQIWLGLKNCVNGKITQVIEKKGGGTAMISVPKELKKNELLNVAIRKFFPNGKSPFPNYSVKDFNYDLIDSKNVNIPEEKSVEDLVKERLPKPLRIYLKTEAKDFDESFALSQLVPDTGGPAPDTLSEPSAKPKAKSTNDLKQYASLSEESNPDTDGLVTDTLSEPSAKPKAKSTNDPRKYASFSEESDVENICVVIVDDDYSEASSHHELRIESPQPTKSLTAAEHERKNLETYSLPVIERSDFKILDKILGAGAQGTVKQGNWLGTDVAVKTIRTGKLSDLDLREIRLLARVRHPNIIQLMAISVENRQTHLVLEFVKGDNLGDILFDSDVRARYSLQQDDKKKILIQICQAISYLHGQANSIIHQDIKPDNILVNEHLCVKLCDLGLGKLKHMATAYMTVVGSIKGTVVYLAPEIILNKTTATTASDIWSLGCTILETFSEIECWTGLEAGDCFDVLQEKMSKMEKPNFELQTVPIGVQELLGACFDFNPEERPSIEVIVNLFTTEF